MTGGGVALLREFLLSHVLGLSGISCARGHNGMEGAPACLDAKSLAFRMPCWTSSWAGYARRTAISLKLPGESVRTGLRAPTKRKSFRQEEREEKKEAREEKTRRWPT